MNSDLRIYQRRLPHWRRDNAVYFVTWRLEADREPLSVAERGEVASAIKYFAGVRYRLFAYVVMDDHVHVLVEPAAPHTLEAIVQGWKSYTTNRMQCTGRSGRVWQPEYFDRIMRDVAEVEEKLRYIVENPAKRWPGVDEYPWVWCDEHALD